MKKQSEDEDSTHMYMLLHRGDVKERIGGKKKL